MIGLALQKNKPLRVKIQTNRIINLMHLRGAHHPRTKPNDSNYKLTVQSTIIKSGIIRT